MRSGYLYLTSCRNPPGSVCLHEAAIPPAGGDGIPIIVRFADVDAAVMHFHQGLHRRLLDPDRHAYRATLPQAAAVLDAIDLRHQRTYLSPELAKDKALPAEVERLRKSHQRVRRIFDWVGIFALVLLLLLSVLLV
jgi:hypothetical protein